MTGRRIQDCCGGAMVALAMLAIPHQAIAQQIDWPLALRQYQYGQGIAALTTDPAQVARCAGLWNRWAWALANSEVSYSDRDTFPAELQRGAIDIATEWTALADSGVAADQRETNQQWANNAIDTAFRVRDSNIMANVFLWLGECKLPNVEAEGPRPPALCDPDKSGIRYGEAKNEDWYVNSEPIDVKGVHYEKYGLPRQLALTELEAYAVYRGAQVYLERGDTSHEVVYVLQGGAPFAETPGDCQYEPYQRQ